MHDFVSKMDFMAGQNRRDFQLSALFRPGRRTIPDDLSRLPPCLAPSESHQALQVERQRPATEPWPNPNTEPPPGRASAYPPQTCAQPEADASSSNIFFFFVFFVSWWFTSWPLGRGRRTRLLARVLVLAPGFFFYLRSTFLSVKKSSSLFWTRVLCFKKFR